MPSCSATRFASLLLRLLLAPLLVLLLAAPAVQAASASSLPLALPAEPVLDTADLLSRSASREISQQLEALQGDGVEARLITIPRLDYGLSLEQLGQQLLQRWQGDGPADQLLLLIDGQTNAAVVVASQPLQARLDPELLRSTGRTTLAQPLRDGGRYRQASLDALQRLAVVLRGGEDPGAPPVPVELEPTPSNIPSREQTQASGAWRWVVILLVVGTLVPMLTWWVFSR